MRLITKQDIKIPKRKKGSHKGDNGLVLAVGGSEGYVGAIALAGLAALRSGCDLVKIIAPEKAAWAINAYSPDLMTMKLKGNCFSLGNSAAVRKSMEKFDVLLIGNGIGLRSGSKKFCQKTIRETRKFKVIDADAIKSISMEDAENSIVTPHLRELELFLLNSKIDKRMVKKIIDEKNIKKRSILIKKTTQEFLDKSNIILLKGKIDAVISRDKILYNKTGNEGMTRGGTGDVLAGLCAGFLAQSKNLLQSAVNAAYINGLVGDILLKRKKGFTYLASDMVDEIKKISKFDKKFPNEL